jgi:hypothetical protein
VPKALLSLSNIPLPEGRAGTAWEPSKPEGQKGKISVSCSFLLNVVSLATPSPPFLLTLSLSSQNLLFLFDLITVRVLIKEYKLQISSL